jgi:hypothetical protein
MGQGPTISLRLITDHNKEIDHSCPLCLFLHDPEECPGQNNRRFVRDISRPTSHRSDTSRYSERTVDNFAFFGSTKGLRARVITAPPKEKPILRRKMSPTDVSLRELNQKQSSQTSLRQRQSEERLQQVYEEQILAYLESPLAEKGFF